MNYLVENINNLRQRSQKFDD